MTVVGVVGNVRHFGLDDIARREMFRPYSQAAWPAMTIVTRTASAPASFAAAVRAALQMIVAGAMRPVAVGIAVGAAGAVFASRLLGTLLFGVKPGDPAVIAAIAALLTAAAAAASLVPGARATRVDPIAVLKVD